MLQQGASLLVCAAGQAGWLANVAGDCEPSAARHLTVGDAHGTRPRRPLRGGLSLCSYQPRPDFLEISTRVAFAV